MIIYFKLLMFPDITHIKVNDARKSAILNSIELKSSYFDREM